MASTPPGSYPAESLQPNIYAAVCITTALAVVAVPLRFLARRLIRTDLWLDDWLSLVALVCPRNCRSVSVLMNNLTFKICVLGFDINYQQLWPYLWHVS